jgi:hypothetical protein
VICAVSSVCSSLPRSDLLLLSYQDTSKGLTRLPVSPYPSSVQSRVRTHLIAHNKPSDLGWAAWTGGSWSGWFDGTITGYRDFAGGEAKVLTNSLSEYLESL